MKRKNLISLGMSCQSAHQLARIAGEHPEQLTFTKGPFDWLICPAPSAAKWLNAGLPAFDPDEIIEHRGHAFWPRMDFWFWHGFMRKDDPEKPLDIKATSQRELKKLAHQSQIFRDQSPAETLFVWSNVQNNLDTDVFPDDAEKAHHITQASAQALRSALDRFYGSPTKLLIISRPDRDPDGVADIHLPKERSEWKGDDAAWDHLVLPRLPLS